MISNSFDTVDRIEFVNRIKNKDSDLILELVEKYYLTLYRVACGRGLSREEAEDVVANCWSTFFEKSEKFEGRSNVKTYLFGILFNKIRELKRKTAQFDDGEVANQILESNFDKSGMWAYKPSDPESMVRAIQIRGVLEECMSQLNESQKMALQLKDLEGLSLVEICETLQIKVNTLKITLHRVRNQVRRCVEGKIV